MFKKILLSSSLLLAGSASSFADLSMSYDAYANSYIQDQATLARKAIGGDFLVDKFMPFFEIENALDLFAHKYSIYKSEVSSYLNTAIAEWDPDDFFQSTDFELGQMSFVTLIEHMRAYIADPTSTTLKTYLMNGAVGVDGLGFATNGAIFKDYLANELGFISTFISSNLGADDYIVGVDDSLKTSFSAEKAILADMLTDLKTKLHGVGGSVVDATVVAWHTKAQAIYDVLNGAEIPEQSIYSYLENKIGVLDSDVEALKARTNHILKILSRY